MPYKDKICGVYRITTPAGTHYVGSSTNVKLRWVEHRGHLRRGTHHSKRLQRAFAKHGAELEYVLIERCSTESLNEREQFWIDSIGAKLNTTPFVANVWTNVETRERLAAVHGSREWSESRRQIALRGWEGRRKPVSCSDGREFVTATAAGKAFGTSASRILALCKWQHRGKIGVRFKFASEDWKPEMPLSAKIRRTKKANGTTFTAETIGRMRDASKGRKPTKQAMERAVAASRVAVIGTCKRSGEVVAFGSVREAAQAVRKEGARTAATLISRACSGRRPSALGYTWVRSRDIAWARGQAKREAA